MSFLAALAWLGFLVLTPVLLLLPIYSDEIQWRLINARYFLDGGRLLYLFPACSNGFLNTAPITFYPYWILNSLAYANMSDTRWLRVWGVAVFLFLLIATALLLPKIVPTKYGLLSRIGIVLSLTSIGVLPFLMSFNRPEEHVLLVVFLAIAIVVLVRSRATSPSAWMTWLLAAAYSFLATLLMAAHIKGLFLMPALLIAAWAAIRRPLPFACVASVASVSVWETFLLWRDRTNCPESEFLTKILGSLTLSPKDLGKGLGPFLEAAIQNLKGLPLYWNSIRFLPENQSQWLPKMDYPVTSVERFVNACIPIVVALGFVLIACGVLASIAAWIRKGRKPSFEIGLAVCLGGFVPVMAGYQINKNFYEAGLILPVLGFAAIFSLRALPPTGSAGRLLLIALLVLGIASQASSASRFYRRYGEWSDYWKNTRQNVASVERLVARCGVPTDGSASRIMMDMTAYSVLWRDREPMFLELLTGWWGTGIDQDRLLKERNVSAVVGDCSLFPPRLRIGAVGEGNFCCIKLHHGRTE